MCIRDSFRVDVAAFFERPVEFNLADLTAQSGLRQLRDCEPVVTDPVRSALRIQDLEIEHAVDTHLDVIARDADLLWDIHRVFLQGMAVADGVHERDENVESRVKDAVVTAQTLHDVSALLRHDHSRTGEYDEKHERQNDRNNESTIHRWDSSV